MDFSSPKNHWNSLRESLAGSFMAHARGLTAKSFVLVRPGGGEFGRLDLDGTAGVDLSAGGVRAEIRENAKRGYRMTSGGSEVLTAERERGSADRIRVSCGGKVYRVRTSFLRNRAMAVSAGGEVARLNGNLSGRSYKAVFEAEDGGAVAVALFLLYHTAAHRRRAYLTTR